MKTKEFLTEISDIQWQVFLECIFFLFSLRKIAASHFREHLGVLIGNGPNVSHRSTMAHIHGISIFM